MKTILAIAGVLAAGTGTPVSAATPNFEHRLTDPAQIEVAVAYLKGPAPKIVASHLRGESVPGHRDLWLTYLPQVDADRLIKEGSPPKYKSSILSDPHIRTLSGQPFSMMSASDKSKVELNGTPTLLGSGAVSLQMAFREEYPDNTRPASADLLAQLRPGEALVFPATEKSGFRTPMTLIIRVTVVDGTSIHP